MNRSKKIQAETAVTFLAAPGTVKLLPLPTATEDQTIDYYQRKFSGKLPIYELLGSLTGIVVLAVVVVAVVVVAVVVLLVVVVVVLVIVVLVVVVLVVVVLVVQ